MRQLDINKGQHAARGRRRRDDDMAVQLDPRDPDIARANQLEEAVARRRARSASEGETT